MRRERCIKIELDRERGTNDVTNKVPMDGWMDGWEKNRGGQDTNFWKLGKKWIGELFNSERSKEFPKQCTSR